MDQNYGQPLNSNESPKGSFGPTVGIIIIIVILIAGALYFWGNKLNNEEAAPINQENAATLSGSDEIGDIQTDLTATEPTEEINLDNL